MHPGVECAFAVHGQAGFSRGVAFVHRTSAAQTHGGAATVGHIVHLGMYILQGQVTDVLLRARQFDKEVLDGSVHVLDGERNRDGKERLLGRLEGRLGFVSRIAEDIHLRHIGLDTLQTHIFCQGFADGVEGAGGDARDGHVNPCDGFADDVAEFHLGHGVGDACRTDLQSPLIGLRYITRVDGNASVRGCHGSVRKVERIDRVAITEHRVVGEVMHLYRATVCRYVQFGADAMQRKRGVLHSEAHQFGFCQGEGLGCCVLRELREAQFGMLFVHP